MMKNPLALFAWSMLTVTIAGCGGGSSSPEQATTETASLTGKATVAIVLTDAGADDYDHAYATITSVELLGESGQQTIFSGSKTVDLLALRDTVQILAVNENVDPGDYEKIRMRASRLVLTVEGERSSTETEVDLVANGKIDLNPHGTFTITAGDVVFISFDWDVNESLKLTETGNGRIKMRPVVFVEVGAEPAFKEGLVRVSGVIDLIASDFTNFRICSLEDATQLPSVSLLNELCLDVIVNDKTGLFGKDGRPVLVSDLARGEAVTVLGLLRRTMDGPTITPLENANRDVASTPFQLLAIVVEGGAPGTWRQLRGTLKSTVDGKTSAFGFLVDIGQGFPNETVLTGQLFDMTRIFSISRDGDIAEITAGGLKTEDRAVVDAVQVPAADASAPGILRIALMLARTPGAIDVTIEGRILSVDPASSSLRIATDSLDRCVTATGETRIFAVVGSEDSVETKPIALDDIPIDRNAFVTGEDGGGGCFAADLIIVEAQSAALL